jgi:FkbM family methyltransferase
MIRFQNVYNLLNDKESKDIFIKKMMFYITKDYSHIFEIVSSYVKTEGVFKWDLLIESLLEASKTKRIIIYGAGGEGDTLYSILESKGISIEAFCDRNPKLNGIKRKPVILPSQLIKRYREKNDCCIVIGTEMFYKEIFSYLIANSVDERDIYGGSARVERQYFDGELIRFSSNEVFVDGGALNLDTSRILLSKCDSVNKIYAFEPDSSNYKNCLKVKETEVLEQIEVFNLGLYNKTEVLSFTQYDNGSSHISCKGNSKIHVVALDEVLQDKNITFIKMDIEGAELDALHGAATIIKKYRPKLAISIYHRPNHIIDIPTYLKTLIPDYKLYIRHYSIYPQETILYAI